MKKWGWIICVAFIPSILSAQAMIYSAEDSSSSKKISDSSISLLKSSFAGEDISSSYSETVLTPEPAKQTVSQTENKADSAVTAKKTAATSQTAQPAVVKETTKEPSAAAASKKMMDPNVKAPDPATVPAAWMDPNNPPPSKEEVEAYLKKMEKERGPLPMGPTAVEQDIDRNNGLIEATKKSTATIQRPVQKTPTQNTTVKRTNTISAQDQKAKAELDYAAKKMAAAGTTAGRYIPQAASQSVPVPEVKTSAKQPFNPNDYRPGVEWKRGDSTHFIIYQQKRDNGIGSSNMGMIFESAYDTLRRNIPWMMAKKVRVFVYQDHESYLAHEPNAKEWTRALAYPTRGEIVVYDEPGKQKELKEVFTHELVHVFTQQFFDTHKTGRLMTPIWLDEGLAVYMEDQSYSGSQGGPWANDLRRIPIVRDPKNQAVVNFSSSNMFGSNRSTGNSRRLGKRRKPLRFMPFDEFMREGSLSYMESHHKTQEWYLQAYAMVRFLLNPSGGMSPSNRMQFEQFTRLLAQGEQMRDPTSGFPVRDANGKPVYKPYSVEKALDRVYHYNNLATFEDAFWRWADNIR